ncbi:AbrB family transcriptional regulator [Bacillus circulans]|nr:AbrB family transcriptional regulator [Niallia circulans]
MFQVCQLPLSWLLGPMFSTILYVRLAKISPKLPFSFRDIGLLIIGYLIGRQFTSQTLIEMGTHLPSMLFMTVVMLAFSILLAFITSRLTHSNLKSTVAGSIPGGLSQMVAISSEIKGIDLTVVTVIQISRILSVMILVPLLVYSPILYGNQGVAAVTSTNGSPGYHWIIFLILFFCYLIASIVKKWKFPAPFMIGPMLLVATISIAGMDVPAIPTTLACVAQTLIGIDLGLQIKFGNIENKAKFLSVVTVTSALLVLFSLVLGYILVSVDQDISLLTAFIGLAPGGMAEMAVLGQSVHANLPIITTYQLFRLLFILFCVPMIMKWGFQRVEKRLAERKG